MSDEPRTLAELSARAEGTRASLGYRTDAARRALLRCYTVGDVLGYHAADVIALRFALASLDSAEAVEVAAARHKLRDFDLL